MSDLKALKSFVFPAETGNNEGSTMPALASSPPEIYPTSIDQIVGPWCAVCTRSRQEKQLAQFLLENKISYFLPYVETAHNNLSPMFDSFLFVAFPSENKWELDLVRSHRAHFRFLFTDNQPRIKAELSLIASESPNRRTLKLERIFPREGAAVRFKDPALNSLEGKLKLATENDANSTVRRVYVVLQLLGQPVSIETTIDKLEMML